MTLVKTTVNRRSFLRAASLAGGGLLLSFSSLAGEDTRSKESVELPEEWFEMNSYISIGSNGMVTLKSPNPEFGQNIKTSMPMILAEELDVDWKDVVVEQADFLPNRFKNQFTGGSQAIRQHWMPLRTAGATARQMLSTAAARAWKVPVAEISTEAGKLIHEATGKKASYGEFASAAAKIQIPKEVELKKVSDFKIIGTSKRNVDIKKIITGKPLYSLDHKVEGMQTAMIVHPPAFGLQFKSLNDKAAKLMPGIKDVFVLEILPSDFERGIFDTMAFVKVVVVVGRSTWEVIQAKKALKIDWEPEPERTFNSKGWGGALTKNTYPVGLESSKEHYAQMEKASQQPGEIVRKDGNPEQIFASASKVIERTFTAPFLAHNTMEPMSCFAHVTADHAEIYAPIQSPEFMVATLEKRLGIPKEKINLKLARMGGGFGRRFYGHHLIEAALISQKTKTPIKLVYTREDEMTGGVYRPTYSATYKAALDGNKNVIGFQVKAGGIPESPLSANRFPAGAIDNYQAESWKLSSNITVGFFRAPSSNFMAAAEQSFLDELAAEVGKDPIEFRLELLDKSKENSIGKNNDYDADRYKGVLELVREKSNWLPNSKGVHRGVSAYFCHNSYVAMVADVVMKDKVPFIEKVVVAVDCGIVVNKDAAINMAEGSIVDAIGNALYGEMPLVKGKPQKQNFDTYRMIRMNEAPKKIEVHFIENEVNPTGMGEPPFPPMFAAVANALFKATGKRFYNQPYINDLI